MNEIRTGLMTTGCDGQPVINPLDGSTCNGAGTNGTSVLFNPQTRRVLGTLGKPAAGIKKTTATHTASCDIVRANLKAKRRFFDDLGNMYGPDGAWLGHSYPPATLETEYVHRFIQGYVYNGKDSGDWFVYENALGYSFLDKTSGVATSISLPSQDVIPPPTLNDTASSEPVLSYGHHGGPAGIDDVTLSGTFDGISNQATLFSGGPRGSGIVTIIELYVGSTGTPDQLIGAITGSITGGFQSIGHGLFVKFGATTGHTVFDSWVISIDPNNHSIRYGIGVRGTIAVPNPCINGGFPNTNVLVTSEDDVLASSHALVVRDATSLALLYRKALVHDGTPYSFANPGQKFSFSTTDEGLFFAQVYTAPTLGSPPTPYPAAEYGAPDPRKIAVISVDPLTFEPTILELITLEGKTYTAGSTFAVAKTLP